MRGTSIFMEYTPTKWHASRVDKKLWKKQHDNMNFPLWHFVVGFHSSKVPTVFKKHFVEVCRGAHMLLEVWTFSKSKSIRKCVGWPSLFIILLQSGWLCGFFESTTRRPRDPLWQPSTFYGLVFFLDVWNWPPLFAEGQAEQCNEGIMMDNVNLRVFCWE